MSTAQERRLRIWNAMTPAQRDYDRFAGVIPHGASWACETEDGAKALEERRRTRGFSRYETGCACHINPPCSFCLRSIEEETE